MSQSCFPFFFSREAILSFFRHAQRRRRQSVTREKNAEVGTGKQEAERGEEERGFLDVGKEDEVG